MDLAHYAYAAGGIRTGNGVRRIIKEVNPMRFTKYFVVFVLCLLMGSCPVGPNIDIGYYEELLDAWNNQNMLDYKLDMVFSRYSSQKGKAATIIVRNGIPESSDPSEWLASGEMSTVPEIYSFIKEEAERIKKANASSTGLYVSYNTVYHYPNHIVKYSGGEGPGEWEWNLKLTPGIWTNVE
jgi:hypothetical protein